MSTVLKHSETILAVLPRVEVVVLLVSPQYSIPTSRGLTFNPFICLYRLVQPAPTAQTNGLDRSSASSIERPRSTASCIAKSHCLGCQWWISFGCGRAYPFC